LFKCHEQQLLSIIWIGFIPCQPARVLKTAACIDCIHRSLDWISLSTEVFFLFGRAIHCVMET